MLPFEENYLFWATSVLFLCIIIFDLLDAANNFSALTSTALVSNNILAFENPKIH